MPEIWWLKYLSLPCCGTRPELLAGPSRSQEVETGLLRCRACDRTYPIRDGIIHLGETSEYATSFGVQWKRFAGTQIDHLNGTLISEERLTEIAGGSLDFLSGAVVYDAGCGAGRFTAVAAAQGARVIATDLALGAVEACRRNTRALEKVVCVHAAPQHSPVQEGSVDVAMSIGVYQHTPDPPAYLRDVARAVRIGGHLVFWGYERRLRSLAHPKYVLRPLARRLPAAQLLRMIECSAPRLLQLSDALRGLRGGATLSRLVPIANYRGILPLEDVQRLEWAVLDTFDWLSPRYDRPIRYELVSRTLAAAGYVVERTLADSIGCICMRSRAAECDKQQPDPAAAIAAAQDVYDRLMPDDRQKRVLDAGCGSASVLSFDSWTYVVGLDVSPTELARNERLDERIVGNLETYQLEAETYDAVVCWNVLEHLSRPEVAVTSMAKSLRRGGLLIIALPLVWSAKALVAKFTPLRFHIWVYRRLLGSTTAGTRGYGPYKTYMRVGIAPNRLESSAARLDLQLVHSSLYESQVNDWLPHSPVLVKVWQLMTAALKRLTLGRYDPRVSDALLIFVKDAGAVAHEIAISTVRSPSPRYD